MKLFSAGFLLACVLFVGIFSYYYAKYDRIVDRRMAAGVFSNAARIYARPQTVFTGEKLDAAEVAANLRRAGYSEGSGSPVGYYTYTRDGLEVTPGPQSFHASGAAVIRFAGGKVASIRETGDNGRDLQSYELEPQLVTALFEGQDRSKRELIKFQDMPPV
ncbi:MAG TPA: hypothetical protein VKV05_01570, partial [Terriglobales bacterium]|nr:hypothetical protein [Terriglobales bacterium]